MFPNPMKKLRDSFRRVFAALGPTTASFATSASAGATITTFTGLSAGETVVSVAPNDGRIAIGGGGTTAVVGLTASSAGTVNYTFTTSAGRTVVVAVTASAAPAFIQPYNQLYTSIGDSRDVQSDATSTGQASFASYVGPHTGGKLRPSPTWAPGKGGIGAESPQQVYAWPRPAGPNSPGAITLQNSTMTLTTPGTSAGFALNRYVTGPGLTGVIQVTALLTGTQGAAGSTYSLSADVGPSAIVLTNTAFFVFRDTKTIAEIAADQGATLLTQGGTNGAGSPTGTAAMAAMIAALTVPGTPLAGYRPNGEATDQPLPLYQGRAKNIVIVDETRRGKTWQGATNSNIDSTNLRTHAQNLAKYHYASGDALANPRVYVAHIYDDPMFADLTSVAPDYFPRAGWLVDGLHYTNVLAWKVGQKIANGNTVNGVTWPGLAGLLTGFSALPFLADTTMYPIASYDGNNTTGAPGVLNPDPCFTNTLGAPNVTSAATLTIEAGSQCPANTYLTATGATGLTLALNVVAVGGNLGNKLVGRLYGPPSSNGQMGFRQGASTGAAGSPSSAKLLTIRATDIVQLAYKMSMSIVTGYIRGQIGQVKGGMPGNTTSAYVPGQGATYSAGDIPGTHELWNNVQASTLNGAAANTDAVIDSGTYLYQSVDGMPGANPPGAGTFGAQWEISWWADGGPIDVTFEISQFTLCRIPNPIG